MDASSSEDDGPSTDEAPYDPTDAGDDDPGVVEDTGGSESGGDAPVCGDGLAQAPEECDGLDLAEQSCEAMGAEGTLHCKADCKFDLCDCTWEDFEPEGCSTATCGDGMLQRGEECDGTEFGARVPTCTDELGSEYHGTVACTAKCELDTTACWPCGDGIVQGDETCDGSDLGGATCEANGFVGGEVACDEACGLDLSQCGSCGDGIVNGDEECEPGDLGGYCGCTQMCTIDESTCVDLMISEILYAPLVDPEAKEGQWIELYNPSASEWSLQGCVVTGDLLIDTFEIDAPIVIPAGGYVTLGAGTEEELGFVPTFAMPIAVTLFNDGDTVMLSCDDLMLDVVTYGVDAPWPGPPPGTAIALAQLDPTANDDGAAWCPATTAYRLGQLGTPGAPNDCP